MPVTESSVLRKRSEATNIRHRFNYAVGVSSTASMNRLAKGHVFANAQTGNVVLFAVYATGGDWAKAVRHIPPIASFIIGVAAAKLLTSVPGERRYKARFFVKQSSSLR